MAKHEEIIRVTQAEFDRINRLLAIPSLEDMTDDELSKIGAKTNSSEYLYFVDFDDGSSLTWDLCSGTHNYYDNVVWTSPNGKLDACLDCNFELDDIEFEFAGETYMVKIVKE